MSVLAVIPARGGSKGVPGKNLRTVGGRSLVARAVGAARAAASVDRVVVSTDDPAIARAADAAGAVVIMRPAALSTDDAASEAALLHALAIVGDEVDVLVFLQATSPFIDSAEVDAAVARVRSREADVVFAAIATPVFLWAPSPGPVVGWAGINHAAARRPRRQELPPQVAETGAFYVMDATGFREAGHRFFGRIEPAIVGEGTALEIDTEEQLLLADALAGLIEGGRP
ncbi:MAG: acylneuraminate cytidylyltransferase family protein [Microcella sp.]|uniref:acylneuraminate cytidylyltransferase family protein n=1 Tax=Microcella sp. TaxID=1913979 RepID=UPI002728179F|nr:acylneuraminate cytidylyltransferase family protein [Microcella sp.]MDO8336650.1 acylneuraminate cytidylyltransferase family protein [Microcella sp.]